MTFDNELECQLLIDSLKKNGTQEHRGISDYTEKMKPELFEKMKHAVQLKRDACYEESLSLYFEIIKESGNILSSDLCRGMAKTLCAMNEYGWAFSLLLMCVANTLDRTFIGQNNSKLLNASTMDCAYVALGIKKAAEGDTRLIIQRTIDVSGDSTYHSILSPYEITEQAKAIMDGSDKKYYLPKNVIDQFLEWPIIQAFFAEEYTYAACL